jgi:4-amino-4-deoxy-L-arabinose transferase-like glycosyltransferase
MKNKKVLLFIPIALFVLTLLGVGRNLRKPFVGIHDWNGARYGNIARNYLRYGFSSVKMGQVENSGGQVHSQFSYYTHYPPILPILISISYRILGITEAATRLVPLLTTAGSVVLIYFIGRTIFRWEVGLIASLFALATPMVRYFGKNPVHEPLALFFALISFFGSALVLKKEKRGWLLVYLGLILTSLTNWSGIFLGLALSLIFFRKVSAPWLMTIWFGVFLLTGLHFVHIYVLTQSFAGGDIFEAFLLRTSLGGSATLTSFSLLEFINQIRLWSSILFTLSLLATSLIGCYFLMRQGVDRQKIFLLGLLIYGAGYPLAFPNATFLHNYFIYGLTAFLGLTAAYGIYSIPKTEAVRIILFFIVFMLIWFERRPYFLTLGKSQGDELAYRIGSVNRVIVPEEDTVLITPYSYGASRLPILSFYLDRKITLDPKSEYNWKVEVNEDESIYKLSQ